MGQYYYPIIIADNANPAKPEAYVYSHKYDNGLKLMEHSWIGNNFVSAVESLLMDEPKHLVWAGDYADEEQGLEENLYQLIPDSAEVQPEPRTDSAGKVIQEGYFIANHTLQQYVAIDACPETEPDWRIHPLPLLTCEGNGRGGGDYRGSNPHVGAWARHSIQIMNTAPKGYTELRPDFKE